MKKFSFSQEQRDILHNIFVELLKTPRELPHDIDQIAAQMVIRTEGFWQYQILSDEAKD